MGELLFRLRTLRLTEAQAEQLAHRIAHLAGEQGQIEDERQKQAKEEAKNSG